MSPNKTPDCWTEHVAKASSIYHNTGFPASECDYCGKTYHGPSVYCSWICAQRDGGDDLLQELVRASMSAAYDNMDES